MSLHVSRAELVDKSFRVNSLLNDAFLVILANGARQLVIVHLRSVLTLSPQLGDAHRVFDLEDSCSQSINQSINKDLFNL